MGTNTDPYQPIEERFRITRSLIELLLETRHPFTITTKSDRVLRDLDLLKQAAELGLASRCLVGDLARPGDRPNARAARPAPAQAARRDQGAERRRRALPMSRSPRSSRKSPTMSSRRSSKPRSPPGARGGFYLPVRLPHEVAPLFRAWLDEHFPDRAAKVMATIRSLRGGRDNDPDFFSRMRGQGPWADLLRTRFEKAARRYGLSEAKFELRRDLFRPPEGAQMRLI